MREISNIKGLMRLPWLDFQISREQNERRKINLRWTPQSLSPVLHQVVLLYVNGLSEATPWVLKKYDRAVSFRPASSVGQQLFKPKDKSDPLKMSDKVYNMGYKNCDKYYYIGETSRTLYVWQKENQAEAEKASNTNTFSRQQRKIQKYYDIQVSSGGAYSYDHWYMCSIMPCHTSEKPEQLEQIL